MFNDMPEFTRHVREQLGPLPLAPEREAEIVEEIAGHIRGGFEEARRRGVPEDEALALAEEPFVPWADLRARIAESERTLGTEAARLERGIDDYLIVKRKGAGGRLAGLISDLWQDLRFAVRSFRRRPVFTVVAVLTLGLGIGATTTMYSVIDGVLLRQLPFDDSGELITLWRTQPQWRNNELLGPKWDRIGFYWQDYQSYVENSRLFEHMAIHHPAEVLLTGEGQPDRLMAGVTTASLFPLLGIRPQLGRVFTAEEEGDGASHVAILSGETWTSRFGSDPSIVGRTIMLDEQPFEVIGVLPAGIRLYSSLYPLEIGGIDTGRRDLWVPVGFDSWDILNLNHNLEFIGRPVAEASPIQIRQEALGILTAEESWPPETDVRLGTLRDEFTRGMRSPLVLLLGAAGIMLLVACGNVANLLMSEAVGRRREISTRLTLGAGTPRIVRQMLAESIALGVAGSLIGVVFAFLGIRAVMVIGPYLPRIENVSVDGGVMLLTMAVGIVTGIIYGLAPALLSARRSMDPKWSRMGRTITGGAGRFQRTVMMLEIALTAVLLVSGGLLARTLLNLRQTDPGFTVEGLTAVHIDVLPERYKTEEQIIPLAAEVLRSLEAVPGVNQVSGIDYLPFPGTLSGQPIRLVDEQEFVRARCRIVFPHYHEIMGIRLLAGRVFSASDGPGDDPVVVISASLARSMWPDSNPIGNAIWHFGTVRTVIGVVDDITEGWLGEETRPMFYLPYAQLVRRDMNILVKTSGDPAAIIPRLREAVWAVDPDIPVTQETTLASLVAESTSSERYRTLLIVCFAVISTLLAAVGIFGITARNITARAREMGVRLAVGARVQDLVGMMLRQTLQTGLAGVTLGLLGAVWSGRLLAGFLFGVEPWDPVTYAGVALVLLAVCLTATYISTRRIAEVDPVIVLRAE